MPSAGIPIRSWDSLGLYTIPLSCEPDGSPIRGMGFAIAVSPSRSPAAPYRPSFAPSRRLLPPAEAFTGASRSIFKQIISSIIVLNATD